MGRRKILAGVSGGTDSMYLASLLLERGEDFGIACCNFNLRGEESDGDFAFVKSWAEKHSVPFYGLSTDTRAFASDHGISIEMAARRIRYRFFGETARREGYDAVAVAHNANDNAETLILNLLRGTSINGVTGMKEVSAIPDPEYCDIPLLRPLLAMERSEIERLVREKGIPFREDSSNSENDYKRNKIRNLVFPVFKQINPSFIKTLGRNMERFAEVKEILEKYALEHPEEDISQEDPLPPLRVEAREEPWDGSLPVKQVEGTVIVDADVLGGEPSFRPWKDGDWIRPLGLHGRKKLQDWFSDRHYTPQMKRRAVLLEDREDSGRILSIDGKCIDEKVRVTPSTRRIYRITVSESLQEED